MYGCNCLSTEELFALYVNTGIDAVQLEVDSNFAYDKRKIVTKPSTMVLLESHFKHVLCLDSNFIFSTTIQFS